MSGGVTPAPFWLVPSQKNGHLAIKIFLGYFSVDLVA